jgi:hypothetical protein
MNMRRWRLLLILGALISGFTAEKSDAQASIYVCDDGMGNLHFTNLPQSADCQVFRHKPPRVGPVHNSTRAGKKSPSIPSSAAPFTALINHFASRFDLDPHLVAAIIQAESNFDPKAVSARGAQGLMQLMPDTARDLMVQDPFDPAQNIEGGTRYLRSLLDTFEGDLTLSIAAYNAGPTVVGEIRKVPPYPETRTYVQRVLDQYKAYAGGRTIPHRKPTIRVRDIITVQ